jgi:hypothetical protein
MRYVDGTTCVVCSTLAYRRHHRTTDGYHNGRGIKAVLDIQIPRLVSLPDANCLKIWRVPRNQPVLAAQFEVQVAQLGRGWPRP